MVSNIISGRTVFDRKYNIPDPNFQLGCQVFGLEVIQPTLEVNHRIGPVNDQLPGLLFVEMHFPSKVIQRVALFDDACLTDALRGHSTSNAMVVQPGIHKFVDMFCLDRQVGKHYLAQADKDGICNCSAV
jgi:hypothetical protein